ncbi:OLC1v1028985C1 [Oldenlandia corymbosa var. corymbosa]|uniref:dual-specificity kinase n=1 Tax=Oldenlandia corymbosa var. corymbosa TaxID=529605 RepID=A0AAV1CEP8_OLDCO|nr:OLC1v1028985C1 [Oldenlandia corymbosa var. corymbosa]
MAPIETEGKAEQVQTRKRRRLAWDVAPSEQAQAEEEQFKRKRSELARHVSPPKRDDDREGHYVFNLGENLTSRYKILSKMGEGTFGRVLECWDRERRECVAIKVIRSIPKYREAAMVEVDVLQRLAINEKGDSHCVKMQSWFDYRNHICIVFEKLGPSLYGFLKRNKYCPFPLDLVREFARQLLESVAYMHDLGLIHTDLKPENILLVGSEFIKLPGRERSDEHNFRCLPKSSAIKLIDFGSSVYGNQNHYSVVTTRHYRAPEVILGLGWSYPCDMWSVGCILVELCTGKALFQTHENLEHLAMMERVLGRLPEHMTQKATRGAEKFFKGSRLNWPEGAVSRESIQAVLKLDRLKYLISRHGVSSKHHLVDLLHGVLKYDPSMRLTARQALDHPFFKDAVATGILSKRWELPWTSVPCLDFDDNGLHFKKSGMRFMNFVRKAITRNVLVLELYTPGLSFHLPRTTFTCKTLVVLKLCDNQVAISVPKGACTPNLKILELNSVSYEDDESASNLISASLVLENLSIRRILFDNVWKMRIHAAALKYLKIEINAPVLENVHCCAKPKTITPMQQSCFPPAVNFWLVRLTMGIRSFWRSMLPCFLQCFNYLAILDLIEVPTKVTKFIPLGKGAKSRDFERKLFEYERNRHKLEVKFCVAREIMDFQRGSKACELKFV